MTVSAILRLSPQKSPQCHYKYYSASIFFFDIIYKSILENKVKLENLPCSKVKQRV